MTAERINIFVPEGHAETEFWLRYLIHPLKAFWGDGTANWSDHESDFRFYEPYFNPTSTINSAECAFLPMTLNYYIAQRKLNFVNDLCSFASSNGLKTYIWIDGDYDVNLEFENAVFLKNASYHSLYHQNEIIRNGDLKTDLLNSFCSGQVQLRSKQEKPIVGFCGLASYPTLRLFGLTAKNLYKWLKFQLKFDTFHPPPIIPLLVKRNQILKKLENIPEIETSFYRRSSFAFGVSENNSKAKLEFVNNILNSDYTLCIRGAANYSMRLYEVMCLGRIPLFLNTDCVLPFENKIAWKDLVLWVEEKDEKYIGKAVLDFHAGIKEKDFLERQYECRRVWQEYLSHKGFFKHFIEDLTRSTKVNQSSFNI
jgi:hypothetical protein